MIIQIQIVHHKHFCVTHLEVMVGWQEQSLPRLIRGQVHRCVGNYDCRRDLLTCVSVRPGQPSELLNAADAVKVCDTEMRVLLQSFSEV